MRLIFTLAGLLVLINHAFPQSSCWTSANPALETRWAKVVSPTNARKEYPRPQLVRENWTNLNGLWQYAITDKDAAKPVSLTRPILFPYPIEPAQTGGKQMMKPPENLRDKRSLTAARKAGEKTPIRFGALVWEATVYLNGTFVGMHNGGYTGFCFDISPAQKEGENELIVKIYEPDDGGFQPHGRQVASPHYICYAASSAFWQTLRLEQEPLSCIQCLTITPDIHMDADLIAPLVSNPDSKPDRTKVEAALAPYSRPAEVMQRRAKVVHALLQQDWPLYKPKSRLISKNTEPEPGVNKTTCPRRITINTIA